MEDRSLGEFFDDGADSEAETDPSGPSSEPADPDVEQRIDDDSADSDSSSDGAADVGDVAPAQPTGGWTREGEPCGACGEAVERRWRQGDALVCADCTEW